VSETIAMPMHSYSREERASANLRWNDGVLEQAVEVLLYDFGVPHKRYVDWRAIPSVSEPKLATPLNKEEPRRERT
jgi:hypothetical protein